MHTPRYHGTNLMGLGLSILNDYPVLDASASVQKQVRILGIFAIPSWGISPEEFGFFSGVLSVDPLWST